MFAAARRHGFGVTAAVCAEWAARYVLGVPATIRGSHARFVFRGETYTYLVHRHGWTWLNERAVEVPIIARTVRRHTGARVLEVGNVLSHYGRWCHEIVDRYERAPAVRNEDVMNLKAEDPYDLIVSISTLEHVGWDEHPRDPARAAAAIRRLKSMLTPGGTLLITLPIGYHHELDNAVREERLGFTHVDALRRVAPGTAWRQVDPAEAWMVPYDEVIFRADAVLICSYVRP